MTTTQRTVLINLLIIVIAGAAVCWQFLSQRSQSTVFFPNTTFRGMDISGMTPDEVADEVLKWREKVDIRLMEDGEVDLSGSAEDFGFTINADAVRNDLKASLENMKVSKEAAFRSLAIGNTVTLTESWSFDEDVLYPLVRSQNLTVKRRPSYDAEIVVDDAEKKCVIKPEVYGNQFAREDLYAWMKEQLTDFFTGTESWSMEDTAQLSLDFPTEIYRKPQVLADDEELNRKCKALNKFAGAKITYMFGSETEKVDFARIVNWLDYKKGKAKLNEDAVTAFVAELAEKYDTRGKDHEFNTSTGHTVTLPANRVEYGYVIDQEAETEQLISEIKGKEKVNREPIYIEKDRWDNPYYYGRQGVDDLNGTYVEVNLTEQHVWFYKNGHLVTDTDCVTGNVSRGMSTTPGIYAVTFKRSPAVLRGGEGEAHYETPVTYWMPFNGGQGLHDATWRGSFGGNIYRYSGSHGCVNLPKSAARTIYQNIERGMPVVVYHDEEE